MASRFTPRWDFLPRGKPVLLAVARATTEVAVADSEPALHFLGADGAVQWSRPLPAAPLDLAIDDAGQRIAAVCKDGTVVLFHTRAARLGKSDPAGRISGRLQGAVLFQQRLDGGSTIALSWDGQAVFLGGRDRDALLLHGPGLRPYRVEDAGPCTLARFLPGLDGVLTVSPTGRTCLRVPLHGPDGLRRRPAAARFPDATPPNRDEAAELECRWQLDLGARASAVAVADYGRLIAVAAGIEGIYVFSSGPGEVGRLAAGEPINQVAVDGAGRTVVAAAYTGRILASDPRGTPRWDYDTGGPGPLVGLDAAGRTLVVTAPGGYVRCLAVGDEGAHSASFLEAPAPASAPSGRTPPRPAPEEVAPLWTRPTASGVGPGAPAEVRVDSAAGAVFLASSPGRIRVFSLAGDERPAVPFTPGAVRLVRGGTPGTFVAYNSERLVFCDPVNHSRIEVVAPGGVGFNECFPIPGQRGALVTDDVGRVLGYDATGKRRWEWDCGGALGGARVVALADGSAIVFSGEGAQGLDPAGRPLWSAHGAAPMVEHCAPAPGGAVAASARELVRIDRAGHESWREPAGAVAAGLYPVAAGLVATFEDGNCALLDDYGRTAAQFRFGEGEHRPAQDRGGAWGILTLRHDSLSFSGLDGNMRWRLPLPSPALAWDVDPAGRFLALLCEGALACFCLSGDAPMPGAGHFLET